MTRVKNQNQSQVIRMNTYVEEGGKGCLRDA